MHKNFASGLYIAIALLFFQLPLIIEFVNASHLTFFSFGLSRLLVPIFILYVLIRVSQVDINKLYHYIILMLLLSFSIWFQLVGFVSLALFISLSASIILLLIAEKSKLSNVILLIATFFLVLPFTSNNLVAISRSLSMLLTDQILNIFSISFNRTSTLYQLSNLSIEVVENCSGATTIRIYIITLLAMFYIRKESSIKNLFALPIIAFIAGLLVNTLRISTHLIITNILKHQLSTTLHEIIGIVFFILFFWVFLQYFTISLDQIKQTFFFTDGICPKISTTRSKKKIYIAITTLFLISGTPTYISLINLPKTVPQVIYYENVNQFGQMEYINILSEKKGRGGWILLEHPVEYCFALRGFQLNEIAKKFSTSRINLITNYKLGKITFANRFLLINYLLFHPQYWNNNISVTVIINENKIFKI